MTFKVIQGHRPLRSLISKVQFPIVP